MPLLATLDENAFGGLDETLKGLYKQNPENKQYFLDIAPDEAGKLAFNLQTEKQKLAENNAELLRQKGEANARLKTYESLGKTPEEIKTALETNRPEDVTKLVTDYEAKLSALQASFDEGLTKEKTAREKYQQQLHKTAVDTKIAQVRAQYDLNDTSDFVLREFFKAEENENGDVVVKIYENGKPALAAGGIEKTPELLLNGFREEKKFLSIFNAGTEGGTGGHNRQTNNFGGAKTVKRDEWARMDATTRSKFVSEGGKVID